MSGPTLTVTINGNPETTTALETRVATVETGLTANGASITDLTTRMGYRESMGVLFSSYGAVAGTSSDGDDCTDALLDYLEDVWNDGSPIYRPLLFSAGYWHFKQADIFSLLETERGYTGDNLWGITRILCMGGIYAQGDAQGLEAGGIIHPVQLIIHTDDNDEKWISKYRRNDGVLFGNWEIFNLSFRHPSGGKGTFLELGDPNNAGTTAEFRNVVIRDCYFTAEKIRNVYATDEGDDGVCFQTEYTAPLVQINNGYQLKLENVGFSGGGSAQLIFQKVDRPVFVGDVHFVDGIEGLRTTGNGVPGQLNTAYAENCLWGFVADSGDFGGSRSEIGYDELHASHLKLGPRDVPAAMNWSIAAGASYIQFFDVPATKTLSNYFRYGMEIELNPDQVGQPSRPFVIIGVDDDNERLTFAESSKGCYVPVAISGAAGSSVTRHIGSCATFITNRIKADGVFFERNNSTGNPGSPNWCIVPQSNKAVDFSVSTGSGALPAGQYGHLVKHVAGTSNNVMSRVILSGNEVQHPPHPGYVASHQIPAWNANYYGAERIQGGWRAVPGRCVSVANNQARELLFAQASAVDPLLGYAPYVFRMNDLLSVAYLRLFFPAYAGQVAVIRAYHPSGGSGFTYDGVSFQEITYAANWGYYTQQLNASASLFRIDDLTDLEIASVDMLDGSYPTLYDYLDHESRISALE